MKVRLQALCGQKLGLYGMVNISELLINVVTVEEPKMLTGSVQKDK